MQQKFQSCWSLFGDGLGSGDLGLRRGMSLFGCLAVPLHGLLLMFFDAIAFLIAVPDFELRLRIPLFSGLAKP